MATAHTMSCDFLPTENSSEKSGGQDTVTRNSTRLMAYSWIPAVRNPSLWLRIAGTGECKPLVWTAHTFAPLKTIHGSVCRVTFTPKASGWSVQTSTVRFAFLTASTMWLCNWETVALPTVRLDHAAGSRATNSLLGSSSRLTRLSSFRVVTF